MTRKKQRALWLGWVAEELVALRLRCCGYCIVARRWKSKAGEIDLIALKKGLLVAVEVKARMRQPSGEEITVAQRQRIERALRLFLVSRPELRHNDIRCDAAWVSLSAWPKYIKDAWGERS